MEHLQQPTPIKVRSELLILTSFQFMHMHAPMAGFFFFLVFFQEIVKVPYPVPVTPRNIIMSPVTPGNRKICHDCLSYLAKFIPIAKETRSVAVNTPSLQEKISPPSIPDVEPSRATGSYSLLLGTEEEELQAMLRELLAAFPTQTTESEDSIIY